MLICITKDNNKLCPCFFLSLIARLAAQRAKYIKDKMEETQCYKRALDAQVREQLLFLRIMQCYSSILKICTKTVML